MIMMKGRCLSMDMKHIGMVDNPEAQRQSFEMQKYGRRMHQELAAHPHVYEKHSIEPVYGNFDRPINESV